VSWATASIKGVLVFLYFVVATVYVPDLVLGLGFVADSSAFVRDLVALGVWGIFFATGLWMLRVAQRRGLI
jgi:hypothetical protein